MNSRKTDFCVNQIPFEWTNVFRGCVNTFDRQGNRAIGCCVLHYIQQKPNELKHHQNGVTTNMLHYDMKNQRLQYEEFIMCHKQICNVHMFVD